MYYLITAILFLALGIIWNGKSDWGNFLLKMALVLLAVWGALNFLITSGYVIRGL